MSRWERGKLNTPREKVTSSSEARTVWKNPMARDPDRMARAKVSLKGKGFKVGFSWKF